jgi:peptidoglycan/LPS O-acetylase OafA/YrhL
MNLDYLRLLLATIVATVHLGLFANSHPVFNSEIAVLFFFCISGFLITQSYINSPSLEIYFAKRIARIYPPIVCVVLGLSVVGLLTSAEQSFLRGVVSLLIFQDWHVLAAVNNPAINSIYTHGAFWTLVIELQFYILLPFIIIGLRAKQKNYVNNAGGHVFC